MLQDFFEKFLPVIVNVFILGAAVDELPMLDIAGLYDIVLESGS